MEKKYTLQAITQARLNTLKPNFVFGLMGYQFKLERDRTHCHLLRML